MYILALIAGVLAILYGVINAIGGFQQTHKDKIQSWAAYVMMVVGLLIAGAGVLLTMNRPTGLVLLLVGLVGLHMITLQNGLHMYGKINPRHHLVRLVITLVLLGLAWWGMAS